MIAFEQRACTVLFNLLRSIRAQGPFLLPANICPIVPLMFFKAGHPFEFVDIALNTLCMSHEELVERWSDVKRPRPAGVIYVRTYGAIQDASDVFGWIKTMSPGALIVDDRCLCEPSFDEALAPYADVALYSTSYAKFADLGFGGFGIVRDGLPYQRSTLPFDCQDLAAVTESCRFALDAGTPYIYTDTNWLDTSIPACSLQAYKERVEQETLRVRELKQRINSIYSSRLPAAIQFPDEFQSWRFNIHVREKARVLDGIRKAGFFASGHYAALSELLGAGNGKVSRTVHEHVINLFNDRYFSPELAERLTEALLDLEPLSPGGLFQ